MRPVYRSGFPGRLISPRRHNLVSFSGLSASLYPPSPLSGRGCAHFTPLKVYSHPVSTFPTPLPCASISAKDTTARKQINAPSESPSSTHNLTTKNTHEKPPTSQEIPPYAQTPIVCSRQTIVWCRQTINTSDKNSHKTGGNKFKRNQNTSLFLVLPAKGETKKKIKSLRLEPVCIKIERGQTGTEQC